MAIWEQGRLTGVGLRALIPALSPVVWLTADRVTQQALSLIIFVVLSPILGPRPFGVFAIVMVFVGFCEFILLDGSVEALVTIDDLEHKHTTVANLANLVIAVGLGLAVAALAPWIATAMRDEQIRDVIWAMAAMPALSSLSAVPIAVLRRDLKYKQLAVRSILGLTIGGLFGIGLALAGAGVWALVLQVLAQRFAEFVISWVAVPVRFGLSWSSTHFHDLRPVAVNVFSARMMDLMTGQAPRLILGYTLGPTDVGLFALGNRFSDIIVQTGIFPLTAVGRIELRAEKIGSPAFERDFKKMIQNTALIAFPMALGTAAIVPQLFSIWLNKEWQPGIVPTQLVVLTAVPMALYYSYFSAFMAAKQSSVVRTASIIQGASVVVTALCAAPFGLTATCVALAVRPWVLLPVVALMFRGTTGIPVRSALLPCLHPLVGAVAMAAALIEGSFSVLAGVNVVVAIALQVVVGAILYFAYLYVFAPTTFRPLFSAMLFRFYKPAQAS